MARDTYLWSGGCGVIDSAIRTLYGLRAARPSVEIYSGGNSTAWRVVTERGNWIAKLFAPHSATAEYVRAEVELYELLREHGIRAPEVLPGKDGSLVQEVLADAATGPLIVMKEEELRWLRSASISEAEIRRVAATAARIHGVLGAYPHRERLVDPTYQPDNKQTVGAYTELLTSGSPSNLPAGQTARLAKLEQAMVAYVDQYYPDKSLLTYSVLHGDLGLHHNLDTGGEDEFTRRSAISGLRRFALGYCQV